MKKYAVVFEKAAHNWAAYVPDLPGCVTTGRTLEDGEAVPEPTTVAETVGIQAA